MGTEVEEKQEGPSRSEGTQQKVTTVSVARVSSPTETPTEHPLELPRSIRVKAKIRAEWREFRKRYLTLRRVLFWFFWIGIHVALFTYGWYNSHLVKY